MGGVANFAIQPQKPGKTLNCSTARKNRRLLSSAFISWHALRKPIERPLLLKSPMGHVSFASIGSIKMPVLLVTPFSDSTFCARLVTNDGGIDPGKSTVGSGTIPGLSGWASIKWSASGNRRHSRRLKTRFDGNPVYETAARILP